MYRWGGGEEGSKRYIERKRGSEKKREQER